MNRITVLVDIAGRVTDTVAGSPVILASAVALDSARLDGVRAELRSLKKWGECDGDLADHIADLLASQATAVAVVRLNRDTDAWREFVEQSELLQEQIVKTSRSVAGWAKPTNLLRFILLSAACAAATGHALGADQRPRIVGASGHQLIECSVITDREISGLENRAVFKSFWDDQHIPKRRLAAAGIDMLTESVSIVGLEDEAALLLPDYTAGFGLAASSTDVGRFRIDAAHASRLLGRIRAKGKLVTLEESFDISCDDIFGDVMAKARELADG